MKRNQLPNIYGETVILPPALKGQELEKIPGPPKNFSIVERNFDDPVYDELAELSKKKMEEKRPELQKRMKEQEIENLKRLLIDHEEEMGQDKPTSAPENYPTDIADPELFRPTSITVSERLYNLFQKYSSPPKTVMLPPPSEEDRELSIPIDPNDMGDKFRALLHGDQLDPLTEEPNQSTEDILKELSESDSSPPAPYEKELLRVLRPESHSKDQDAPTRPPPKKAYTSDQMLKLCSKFHDLCYKF